MGEGVYEAKGVSWRQAPISVCLESVSVGMRWGGTVMTHQLASLGFEVGQ